MSYYIEKDNKIVIYNKKKYIVENTLKLTPQFKDLPIKKTDKEIVEFEGNLYFEDDIDYLRLKEVKEKERILQLSMTRSDFFDSTIKAWGLDSQDLFPIIEQMLKGMAVSELERKVALNNYSNALNFYRKHTLFTLLSGIPIEVGGKKLLISKEQWDRFFDKMDKKDPEAYKELIQK